MAHRSKTTVSKLLNSDTDKSSHVHQLDLSVWMLHLLIQDYAPSAVLPNFDFPRSTLQFFKNYSEQCLATIICKTYTLSDTAFKAGQRPSILVVESLSYFHIEVGKTYCEKSGKRVCFSFPAGAVHTST